MIDFEFYLYDKSLQFDRWIIVGRNLKFFENCFFFFLSVVYFVEKRIGFESRRVYSQRDTTRDLIKKKGIEPLINLGFREKEIQRFTVTAIKLIERFWNGSNWSLLGRAKKINKAFHSINLIPPSPRNSTSIPTCLKKEKWNLCISKGKKENVRIFMQ